MPRLGRLEGVVIGAIPPSHPARLDSALDVVAEGRSSKRLVAEFSAMKPENFAQRDRIPCGSGPPLRDDARPASPHAGRNPEAAAAAAAGASGPGAGALVRVLAPHRARPAPGPRPCPERMSATPPLVIDAEDDREGRRILRDANHVRAQVFPQVEPDDTLAVRMSLQSNLPLHTPPFAWPRVTHGVGSGCVRGSLPG
jgi:hypothetical protein